MKHEKKAKLPPKPASLFRKPIPEAAFQKSCLGLIEQAKDREFLDSCLARSERGRVLREGLDREALQRLNKLAKAIKANRGFVKSGPLVLAGILVAGIVVFGLFFMNPLLERAGEGALESIFGAKAEIAAFRLDPIRLRVSMAGIAVADRDEPMTNLFETGRVELRLSPYAILRGRVYIEEASAAAISVGGPRKSSGALPGVPASEKAAAKAHGGAPLVDFEHFDAKALLEREKSNLKSQAAYERAGTAYAEAARRWKERAASSKRSVAELEVSSKKVLAIDPKGIKTAAAALEAVSEAKALVASTQAVAKEASAVADGIGADSRAAAALEKDARAALDADFAYLKSFADPSSGAAMGALDPVIRGLLTDKGERYYYYAGRALETALRLKASSGGEQAAKKPAATPTAKPTAKGRDMAFPSAALPRFRLGHLGAGFSSGGADWRVDLRELSTDPRLVPSPTTLELAMASGAAAVKAKAVADLRSDRGAAYSLDASGEGLPVDLKDALAGVGIGSFSGRASGSLELRGEAEGDLRAKGGAAIRDAVAGGASGALGAALAGAIAGVDAVRLDASYARPAGGEGRLSIKTNLDSIAAKAAAALAARYADKASAEIKAALKDYAGAELEGKLGSRTELGELSSSSALDAKSSSSIGKALDGKVRGLEARAAELGSGALKGVSLPKLKP